MIWWKNAVLRLQISIVDQIDRSNPLNTIVPLEVIFFFLSVNTIIVMSIPVHAIHIFYYKFFCYKKIESKKRIKKKLFDFQIDITIILCVFFCAPSFVSACMLPIVQL